MKINKIAVYGIGVLYYVWAVIYTIQTIRGVIELLQMTHFSTGGAILFGWFFHAIGLLLFATPVIGALCAYPYVIEWAEESHKPSDMWIKYLLGTGGVIIAAKIWMFIAALLAVLVLR